MESEIRLVFDTLSLVSILVLLVLGMGVIVSMMGVFNLAHGEFVLLGAGCALLSDRWLGSAVWGMLLAPVIVGLIGVVLERTVVRRFYGRQEASLLATFAIGLIIRELVRSRMTIQVATVPPPIESTFTFFGAQLTWWRLILIVSTPLLLAVCLVVLRKTPLGLTIRATLDNPGLAESTGISTSKTYAFTFGFGAALAGLAGALIVPVLNFFPDLGVRFLIRSFISVLLGGVGTFAGPVVGATATGVPTGLLPNWLSGVWPEVIVICAAIVVVRFRRDGLLGGAR